MTVRKAHFRVMVGGQDVSSRFLPRLISASITKSSNEATQSASIVIDDSDQTVRFPATGTAVTVELGWAAGAVRRFEGEVDTASYDYDRGSGATISIRARSVSLKGKVKQPFDRHWEEKPLGDVLEEAAGEAGLTINVHADLASRMLPYEAQDNESFFAFADRLAREHGATFAIRGTVAGFVPRNAGVSASGAALPTVIVSRGVNLISVSGTIPAKDRFRFQSKQGRWYDLKRAKMVIEKIQTGEDVEPEGVLRMLEPDAGSAQTRAESESKNDARGKGSGSVVVVGEPSAEPEGICVLSGVRPGVDGSYTIETVTDTLDRGSGYTTQISLGNPQGSAGTDGR